VGTAEPKMSMLLELLTVATVGAVDAPPKMELMTLPILTPVSDSEPLPKTSTLLLLAAAIELPRLTEPKMSMLFELLTVIVDVAGEAEPKTSTAPLAPLFP
jgi:hypothetical protein